jgi:hypothetical protein
MNYKILGSVRNNKIKIGLILSLFLFFYIKINKKINYWNQKFINCKFNIIFYNILFFDNNKINIHKFSKKKLDYDNFLRINFLFTKKKLY